MKGYIDNGVTLIVDRYVYSGVAFSAAKNVSFFCFPLYDILINMICYKLTFAMIEADLEISGM
jgi:thymidylate kinase